MSPLQYFMRRAYIIWAGLWWGLGFFLLFPFFCLNIWFPFLRFSMPVLNQVWCLIFFPAALLRTCTTGKKHLKRGPCIYVSNHASYLDIPLLTFVLPGFPAFMGKSSLAKIPMFGYMFGNLHIVVQRNSARGRAKAMQDALDCLRAGRSVVIFPEGGIHHRIQPGLAKFKDGAFALAVQTGLPLIPVTICRNWYILPDDGRWLPRPGVCKTIIHPPVVASGMSEKDVPELRNRCYSIIAETLHHEIQNGPTKYSRLAKVQAHSV